jgi:Domain of unknown function (DUF4397)
MVSLARLIAATSRAALAASLAAVGIGGALTAPAAAQAPAPGLVTLVHGVRGLVADVYVDNKLALPTFQPLRSTDPIPVPSGAHVVDVRQAGAAATSPPLLHTTVTIASGVRQSAVVHLDAAGKVTASLYMDDVSPVPAGNSRVVVRHAAAAGPINVLVDEQAVASGLQNAHEAKQNVAPGSHQLTVIDPGSQASIAAPQGVNFAEGSATFMYLIGSQADGSLGWAVVNVPGLQTAPTRVQTGDGSLAGGEAGRSMLMLRIVAVTTLVLAGAWVVRRPRSRPRET